MPAINATHLEQVASRFGNCSDHFDQLAAIFRCIGDAAKITDPVALRHIAALAQAGCGLATDIAEETDYWREEVQAHGPRA